MGHVESKMESTADPSEAAVSGNGASSASSSTPPSRSRTATPRGSNSSDTRSRRRRRRFVPSQTNTRNARGWAGRTTTTTTSNNNEPSSSSQQQLPRRVAVIGGGVSGLAAAWHLQQQTVPTSVTDSIAHVHLFDGDTRVGGHAWTVECHVVATTNTDAADTADNNADVEDSATSTTTTEVVPVDIGFMVFNERNYPNMVAWFKALSVDDTLNNSTAAVRVEESNMSLSISLRTKTSPVKVNTNAATKAKKTNLNNNNDDDHDILEWSSDLGHRSAGWCRGVVAQLTSLYWRIGWRGIWTLLSELIRFHAQAPRLLEYHSDDPRRHVTMAEYLHQHTYAPLFVQYYLYPMMAALWSASATQDVGRCPAVHCVSFLHHHQMLQLWNRPVWQTVSNRSIQYVQAVVRDLMGHNNNNNNNDTSDNSSTTTTPDVTAAEPPLSPRRTGLFLQTPIHSVRQLTDGTYQLYTLVHHQNNDNSNNNNTPELIRINTATNTLTTTTAATNDGEATNDTSTDGAIYDDIVFACHAPDAAAIVQRSQFATTFQARQNTQTNNNNNGSVGMTTTTTAADFATTTSRLLESIPYADSVIYVHSDPTLMPSRRRAWASWNCLGYSSDSVGDDDDDDDKPVSGNDMDDSKEHQDLEGPNGRFKSVYVTYWLNRLQNLKTSTNIFVSLNPHHAPDPKLTYHRVVMAHPQVTSSAMAARHELLAPTSVVRHQGVNGLWFCGAWTGYGFHEDGCRSGFEVATAISGVPLPWAGSDNDDDEDDEDDACMVLPPPNLALVEPSKSVFSHLYNRLFYDLPVAVCRRLIYHFLNQAVRNGTLRLKFNDGSVKSFGNGTPCGCDASAVTLRIFDPWFFVKTAWEYDLGLARSYMAGYFVVEPLEEANLYHPTMRPVDTKDETTLHIGDPIGLTRLFLLLIGNRDRPVGQHQPQKAGRGNTYSGAFTNASGLFLGKVGSFFNFVWYKLTMDNSERGGSLRNIHAHYDLSNDLFTTFLDKDTMMYSSAIFDAVKAPSPLSGLIFRGSLEDAQWRKLDTLLDRAQVQPGHELLDIGFGWGGLSIRAAKKYGCHVTGITLSVEQKALADQRVRDEGLQSLITFEVIDYRTFARRKQNLGRFDRVISCEMIEAVGHSHLGRWFWSVEQLLKQDGVLVMEAITTPEQRYETYIRSTDFINTIIFPGSCCPSLHALVDAAYQESTLTLEHIDNIGLHYAHTLAEWRRRFNASEASIRRLGFDDVFLRAWNYYLTYCEAGFFSQTENCLILVFARQGCRALVPLCESRSVTQSAALSFSETHNWITDGYV